MHFSPYVDPAPISTHVTQDLAAHLGSIQLSSLSPHIDRRSMQGRYGVEEQASTGMGAEPVLSRASRRYYKRRSAVDTLRRTQSTCGIVLSKITPSHHSTPFRVPVHISRIQRIDHYGRIDDNA